MINYGSEKLSLFPFRFPNHLILFLSEIIVESVKSKIPLFKLDNMQKMINIDIRYYSFPQESG